MYEMNPKKIGRTLQSDLFHFIIKHLFACGCIR